MNAEDAARRSAEAIGMLPAQFMLDGATYERGGVLGFEGIDFYIAGRGGALGDVDGSVVAAAFVFFNPESVVEGWDRARKVMAPASSQAEFAPSKRHGHMRICPTGVDYARLSDLAARRHCRRVARRRSRCLRRGRRCRFPPTRKSRPCTG